MGLRLVPGAPGLSTLVRKKRGEPELARIRLWHPADLPHLLRMAAVLAWQITPEDDRQATTPQAVALGARMNLIGVLRSPGGTAIVAEEDGRPVGFLLVALQPNDKTGQPQGYMADIYVEPAYQGRGLARQMHFAAEAYLRQIGIRTITNWVHAHNRQGQAASARHGFETWGVMMAKELR